MAWWPTSDESSPGPMLATMHEDLCRHKAQSVNVMMTSPNENIFRVTGPLRGEFTGDQWIPLAKASDANRAWMFSDICAWINGWVNNREAGDWSRHRAHYDVTVMRPSELMWLWILIVSIIRAFYLKWITLSESFRLQRPTKGQVGSQFWRTHSFLIVNQTLSIIVKWSLMFQEHWSST